MRCIAGGCTESSSAKTKSTDLVRPAKVTSRRFGVLDRQEPNVPKVFHALADASL